MHNSMGGDIMRQSINFTKGLVVLIAFLLALGYGSNAFAGVLYGSTRGGNIFKVNEMTGAGTLVGNVLPSTGLGGVTEIEYDNTRDRAWAQGADGQFAMHEFNIFTATGIGGLIPNAHAFNGLEYVGAILYGTAIVEPGGPSELKTLDPETGVSLLVGLTGVGPISGLAYDGATMYGIAGGPGPADFFTLDLLTGAATFVGTTTMQAGSLQFGYDGRLYAGGTGLDDAGDLFTINLATGASTFLGATGFGDGITGLTLVVVPEPSTMLLLGTGLAGLGFFRSRRKREV